jgi:hypothetical protein
MIRRLWQWRALEPLRSLTGQGMTADTLALCVALGLVLGIFPVLGCPTLFCAIAALTLRLNLPAIQAVNYLVYPLQLALLVPFVRLGDLWFRPTEMQGFFGMLTALLHAVAAWFCVCVPLGLLLYWILLWTLRRCDMRHEAAAC